MGHPSIRMFIKKTGDLRSIDVLEISFDHESHVVLFKCDWWNVYKKDRGFKIDKYGIVSLNTRFKLNTNEPFALANHVEQVFYVNDNTIVWWIILVKARPRDYYKMQGESAEDDALHVEEVYRENLIDIPVRGKTIDMDISEGISVRVGEYLEI